LSPAFVAAAAAGRPATVAMVAVARRQEVVREVNTTCADQWQAFLVCGQKHADKMDLCRTQSASFWECSAAVLKKHE
jgi:hypothetical protein